MILKMMAVDWRAMKYYRVRSLLFLIIVLAMGLLNPILVIPTSVFFWLSFSLNPFGVEEKGELHSLYLTMPMKRKTIVTGRYALSLTMLVCGILMGLLLMPLANRFSSSIWIIGIRGYITVISLSYFLYSFFNLFMFPILFRFGYLKGKVWGLYLPAGFIGLIYGVYTGFTSFPGNEGMTIRFIGYASENMLPVNGVIIILATLLLLLSYMLSLRFYSKRDF